MSSYYPVISALTLVTLQKFNIKATGADREARLPAVLNLAEDRVLIFSFGSTSSGVPLEWAATEDAPGVSLLPDLSEASASAVATQITALRKPGDLVVVSIHWGSNWRYHIPDEQKLFARTLIDKAGVSIVHSRASSSSALPLRLTRGRTVIFVMRYLPSMFSSWPSASLSYPTGVRPFAWASVRKVSIMHVLTEPTRSSSGVQMSGSPLNSGGLPTTMFGFPNAESVPRRAKLQAVFALK